MTEDHGQPKPTLLDPPLYKAFGRLPLSRGLYMFLPWFILQGYFTSAWGSVLAAAGRLCFNPLASSTWLQSLHKVLAACELPNNWESQRG